MSAPNYPAKHLSPILPVAEMAVTTGFYLEVLGFEAELKSRNYTILRRGNASLHLTKAAPGVLEKAGGNLSIYLEVEKIELLWEHVSLFKDRYARIRDLFDREYGMREFHIIDPDGCLVFVGQREWVVVSSLMAVVVLPRFLISAMRPPPFVPWSPGILARSTLPGSAFASAGSP